MIKERRKRIYLNEGHTKYCIVRLFQRKIDMQEAYKIRCPKDLDHYSVLGAHNAYNRVKINKDSSETFSNEIGTIFLNLDNCGAGIVAHEFGHAVLWAYKHPNGKCKKQYPIIIKSMDDEEEILYHLTYAISQFYIWYWKVVKEFKKKRKN